MREREGSKTVDVWMDDEGTVRHVGPFTPPDRIFAVNPEGCSVEELRESLLKTYREHGVEHPLLSTE